MRFFRNLSLVLLASATVVSCGSYDDTDLWNEVTASRTVWPTSRAASPA